MSIEKDRGENRIERPGVVSRRDLFLNRLQGISLGPAVVYVFALAYLVAQWNVTLADVGDEGFALVAAWRIAAGQIPHADFFSLPPVSFLPTALVFSLFGVSIVSARILVIFYGMLLLVLGDRILCKFTRDQWVRTLALSILAVTGVVAWPIPSHHWVVDLLGLAAGLALLNGIESDHPVRWGVLGGVLTGLAVLAQQDQGGLLLIGLIVFFFPWLRGRDRRKLLTLSWLGGGIAVALCYLIVFLPSVSLGEIFYQTVVFPLTRYYEVPGQAVGLFDSWRPLGIFTLRDIAASPFYNGGRALIYLMLNLLPFTAVFALVQAFRDKDLRGPRLGVLTALFLAFLGSCARRYIITYLVWAAPALIIVSALWLGRLRKQGSKMVRSMVKAGCIVLSGVLLTHAVLVAYNSREGSPGILTLETRAGTVRMPRNIKAMAIAETVAAIEAHVPPGAQLFCNGYIASFNFLTLRFNPTRYDIFLPGEMHTDEQTEEVLQSLAAKPSAYILTEDALDKGRMHYFFLSRYRVVWRAKGLTLYAPRKPLGMNP